MATTIKIAGLQFEILDTVEAAEATSDCAHDWQPLDKEVVVNPAREFVKGYGCHFVTVKICAGRICKKCGLFEAVSEIDKSITRGDFKRILKMKPKIHRTICQLLRELRDEVKNTDKVDMCLLIAKKMNDKLVEACGKRYKKGWYDEDGNFIG